MNQKLLVFVFVMTSLIFISSCTSQDLMNQTSHNKYIELYQKAHEGLEQALISTRQVSIQHGEITGEEIDKINNLETLVTYDSDRLILIEASSIYEEKESAGQQHMLMRSGEFVQSHSIQELRYLESFICRYIETGTHNIPFLEKTIQSRQDEILNPYIALCAAVVDAYGKETIWKETFEIVSMTPCAKAALIKISLVLTVVALDLAIDSTIPWAAFITMASTINNICQLITIRNEWILCEKNSNKP